MKRVLQWLMVIILGSVIALGLFLFFGKAPYVDHMEWGASFSLKHTVNLGLNWQETFLAILDDLKPKRMKIAIHWDMIQGDDQNFYDRDTDWQMKQLEQRGTKTILIIGAKTPRWPECHIPKWAKGLSEEDQQKAILALDEHLVNRYKHSPVLEAWQVENEPFFPFGECTWADRAFLAKEIALVRSLDPVHPVIITESGEWSTWLKAAHYGDIVGTTMYRKVWFDPLGVYFPYPFPPVYYWRKAQVIKWLFGKEVMGMELQAEPWTPKLLYDATPEEEQKTMDAEKFRNMIEFAKKAGISRQYLWGDEWWYWMKTKQNDPAMWNEAKKLFQSEHAVSQ